jgi:hypothetical protein
MQYIVVKKSKYSVKCIPETVNADLRSVLGILFLDLRIWHMPRRHYIFIILKNSLSNIVKYSSALYFSK